MWMKGDSMVAISVSLPTSIPIGAPVYDRSGRRLGRVSGADSWDLLVERGRFLRRTSAIRLEHVDRVEDNRVILSVSRDEALDD